MRGNKGIAREQREGESAGIRDLVEKGRSPARSKCLLTIIQRFT